MALDVVTSAGVASPVIEDDVAAGVSEGGVRRGLAGVGRGKIRHGDGRQPGVPLRVALGLGLGGWGGLCDRGSLAVTRRVHDDGWG